MVTLPQTAVGLLLQHGSFCDWLFSHCSNFVFIYITADKVPLYTSVGCFADNSKRALPHFLGNVDDIIKCAAKANKLGYLAFGVQYGKQCFSGPRAHLSYNLYGNSSDCMGGRGGVWANSIYLIEGQWISRSQTH